MSPANAVLVVVTPTPPLRTGRRHRSVEQGFAGWGTQIPGPGGLRLPQTPYPPTVTRICDSSDPVTHPTGTSVACQIRSR